jgi:hydrogenase maturation protease
MKKIGVIGIGNPLRRDDGIGILLLEKLVERKENLPEDIEYIDGGTGGMNLLHLFSRYDVVLIIDAVNFNEKTGESKLFTLEDVHRKKNPIAISTHESDILKVIQLSKELGEAPDRFFIFGVQPRDIVYGTDISFELQQKIEVLLDSLRQEIITIFNKND